MHQARAHVIGARAKAGEDVDALVKEAEVLPSQSQVRALGMIAQNGPPARKAELLKKAYEAAAAQQGVWAVSQALPALRYLLPLDREFVKSKLESLRAAPGRAARRDGTIITACEAARSRPGPGCKRSSTRRARAGRLSASGPLA
jgi:hypothetical protein